MDELFNNNATSNADTQVDPKAAYEALVGEGKKYATNELLAASRIHADKFIEKLQQETQELRKELDQRLTVEQLMTKLSTSQNGNSDDAGNRGHIPQPPHLESNPQGNQLTEDAVAKMVQQELSRHQNATREQANTAVVVTELKKMYGENYVQHMQARLGELGISKEAAIQMAATMPKAYIELVGKRTSEPVVNQSPPRGQITSLSMDSNIPKMSDFAKMRKENPREYFKPHVQNQIMQLAQQYGEQFTNR